MSACSLRAVELCVRARAVTPAAARASKDSMLVERRNTPWLEAEEGAAGTKARRRASSRRRFGPSCAKGSAASESDDMRVV